MKNLSKSRSRGGLGRSWGDFGALGRGLAASGLENLVKTAKKDKNATFFEVFSAPLRPWGVQVEVQEAILAAFWASWPLGDLGVFFC